MNYRLEDLSDDDFERLVNKVCQKILGTGTVSFAKGKDGGRDGRFNGTASSYPNSTSPWKGKFIIQAKHTTDYKASCSDNSFHGNKTSIVNDEIEKIKSLVADGEIDNYLLFTNRKETASREDAIKHICKETALVNVDIIGNSTLESWFKDHDDIPRLFKIGLYALPLSLNEFEIKDIIIAFSKQTPALKFISSITEEIIEISKDKKNVLNNLSQEYYDDQIRKRSQQYFEDIDKFLSDFKNESYARMYYNFADELSNKIAVKRRAFERFEEIFVDLYDLIFTENQIELGQDKRLIWIFLHHLYFNCHIGRTV